MTLNDDNNIIFIRILYFYYNTIEIRNKFMEILSTFDIVDLGRSPLNRYSDVRYWRIFIYRVQLKIMAQEDRKRFPM